MPQAATMTVTGKNGPGISMTAVSLTGVLSYTYDAVKAVLQVNCNQGLINIDVSADTTWTTTISSGNQAITIS